MKWRVSVTRKLECTVEVEATNFDEALKLGEAYVSEGHGSVDVYDEECEAWDARAVKGGGK